MSEEGKLKTEIDKLLEKGAEMQYSSLGCVNRAEVAGMMRVGIKPSINILLDEAKAEFPITTEKWYTIQVTVDRINPNDEKHLTILHDGALLEATKEWFKRWFGGVKDE